MSSRSRRTTPRAAALLACGLAAGLLAACTGEAAEDGTPTPTSTFTGVRALTVGVYGAPDEIGALTSVVAEYDNANPGVRVTVQSAAGRNEQIAALRGGSVPDVFLLSRRDLPEVHGGQLNQPVDELLDARGVRFGDYYQRDAIRAFSADDRLQCMPFGISPVVIYYNTDLVDLPRLRRRGLLETETEGAWTFEEFAAAARFASRPEQGTRGVHIEPSLRGLAPFVLSGGGSIFDDPLHPTSLTFSDDGTREALTTTLALLRDPRVTLSPTQLAQQPALEWFKKGRLGMIAGGRDLVPQLRTVPGLSFDVMAMPEISERRTIGDVTALCMSADTEDPEAAADLLFAMIGEDALRRVAQAGYLVPANLQAAESTAFLQPLQEPAHAAVFNAAVADIVTPPLIDDGPELEEAVAPEVARLFDVGVLDLEAVTEAIDEASRPVLAPSGSPSPSG